MEALLRSVGFTYILNFDSSLEEKNSKSHESNFRQHLKSETMFGFPVRSADNIFITMLSSSGTVMQN